MIKILFTLLITLFFTACTGVYQVSLRPADGSGWHTPTYVTPYVYTNWYQQPIVWYIPNKVHHNHHHQKKTHKTKTHNEHR